MCSYLSTLKGIQLAKNVQICTSVLMVSDSKRVKQVLLNLIANAIKFTHEGSVTVTARLIQRNVGENGGDDQQIQNVHNLDTQVDADFLSEGNVIEQPMDQLPIQLLEVSIRDTGIGIKEEDRQNLFQLFGKL